MTITLLYSCKACHLIKVACEVPARGEEDIAVWLEQAQIILGQDHRRRSPLCRSTTCDLMIPMTGSQKVGGPSLL